MAVDIAELLAAQTPPPPRGRGTLRVTVANTDWETYIFPENINTVFVVPISTDGRWAYKKTGAFNGADTDYNTIPAGTSFQFPIALSGNSDPVREFTLSHSGASGVFEFEMYSSPPNRG